MKKSILLLLAVLTLAGCSKRAWYDGFQAGHSQECNKLEGDARDKCLQNSGMSYDQYQKNLK